MVVLKKILYYFLIIAILYIGSSSSSPSTACYDVRNGRPGLPSLACAIGNIVIYTACQVAGESCDQTCDSRFSTENLVMLHKNCSGERMCVFLPPYRMEKTYSRITFACEENLHTLPTLMEDGLINESERIIFYFDMSVYGGSGGQGLECVIKPISKNSILYRNWIYIHDDSKTTLTILYRQDIFEYRAGDVIYRDNLRQVNDTVIIKLVPDSGQSDQISLGFTIPSGGLLDTTCKVFDTEENGPDKKKALLGIVIGSVSFLVLMILVIVACTCSRKRKSKTVTERTTLSASSVSKPNVYTDGPIGRQSSSNLPNDYDYVLNTEKRVNPMGASPYDTPGDAIGSDFECDAEVKNVHSLPRIKSSGYSTPSDAIAPPSDVTNKKSSEYAEPCNEHECFMSKALQNRNLLQQYNQSGQQSTSRDRSAARTRDEDGYHHFERVMGDNSSTRDPNYSLVSKRNILPHDDPHGENDNGYDHFERVRGDNSPTINPNYSVVSNLTKTESDYNTFNPITEDSPNPNYDHI